MAFFSGSPVVERESQQGRSTSRTPRSQRSLFIPGATRRRDSVPVHHASGIVSPALVAVISRYYSTPPEDSSGLNDDARSPCLKARPIPKRKVGQRSVGTCRPDRADHSPFGKRAPTSVRTGFPARLLQCTRTSGNKPDGTAKIGCRSSPPSPSSHSSRRKDEPPKCRERAASPHRYSPISPKFPDTAAPLPTPDPRSAAQRRRARPISTRLTALDSFAPPPAACPGRREESDPSLAPLTSRLAKPRTRALSSLAHRFQLILWVP